MDFEVEVVCTATAGRLMQRGVTAGLTVKSGANKSVYDFIKDAHELGAKFYACAGNLELFGINESELTPGRDIAEPYLQLMQEANFAGCNSAC
jgi:uncharacterized protein